MPAVNPKKESAEKAKNAGISLEPEIKKQGVGLAKRLGFKSLSALTHKLLTDALEKAAQAAQEAGEKKKSSGQRKIKQARGEK